MLKKTKKINLSKIKIFLFLIWFLFLILFFIFFFEYKMNNNIISGSNDGKIEKIFDDFKIL